MSRKHLLLVVACLFAFAGSVHAQNITLLLNSKTITGVSNGGALSTWTGEVGSASVVAPNTAPTYQASSTVGGQPGVRFNATAGTSGNAMVTSLTQATGAYTVFTIYNLNNATGTIRRVLNGGDGTPGDGGGPNWLVGPYAGEHRHYANGWVTNPGPTANNLQPALTTAINTAIGSGTSNFWVNGVLETDTSAPNGGFGTLGLGVAGAFQEAADSDVALVLAFDAPLSMDQRIGVEFLLADAFNLSGFSATDAQIAAGNALLAGTSLAAVPEPTSMALWLVLSVAACGSIYHRRRRS